MAQLYDDIPIGLLWPCILEHVPALRTYILQMGYLHPKMSMQPPQEFVTGASWCIRMFACTIKPGFATVKGDFDALHFMATKIISIDHDTMRITLSLENSTSTHYTLCLDEQTSYS